MIKKIINKSLKTWELLSNLNIRVTDTIEERKIKSQYNKISLMICFFNSVVLTIFYVIFPPIGNYNAIFVSTCLAIYFYINLFIILVFPKSIAVMKHITAILSIVYTTLESIIAGGFSYHSTEIFIPMYIIIVCAALDVWFVPLAVIGGTSVLIMHCILFNWYPEFIPSILEKFNIIAVKREDDSWLIVFFYLGLAFSYKSVINAYKKFKKAYEDENRKKEMDLSLARETLKSIYTNIPKNFKIKYNINKYQIYYTEIGGDFYFFKEINENHYLLIFIDISGHGIPASLFVFYINSEIERLTEKINENIDIEKFTEELAKRTFQLLSNNNRFATISVIEFLKNKINYINHGNFILIHNKLSNSIDELSSGGRTLGIWQREYKKSFYNFNKNDVLFLTSDGLIEGYPLNNNKIEFGIDRIKSLMINKNMKNLKDLNEKIVNEYCKFTDHEINDDITIIAIEKKEN